MKDAFGNEIVIGHYYAYHGKESGWGYITVGRAVEVRESRQKSGSKIKGSVLLDVCGRGRSLYDSDVKVDKHSGKKTASIGGNSLIPLGPNEPDINWENENV